MFWVALLLLWAQFAAGCQSPCATLTLTADDKSVTKSVEEWKIHLYDANHRWNANQPAEVADGLLWSTGRDVDGVKITDGHVRSALDEYARLPTCEQWAPRHASEVARCLANKAAADFLREVEHPTLADFLTYQELLDMEPRCNLTTDVVRALKCADLDLEPHLENDAAFQQFAAALREKLEVAALVGDLRDHLPCNAACRLRMAKAMRDALKKRINEQAAAVERGEEVPAVEYAQ